MRKNLSPAVERACAFAETAASPYSTRDLLVGFLQEEGRVWELLQSIGRDPEILKAELAAEAPEGFLAGSRLVSEARGLASLVGEDDLTSELLLHALLTRDDFLRRVLDGETGSIDGLIAQLNAPPDLPLEMAEDFEWVDEPDRVAVTRAIDANANRAREALRVLDDFCRFCLDDAFLTNEVKVLRHALAEAMSEFSAAHLTASRETERDVGTTLEGTGEYRRDTPASVALVNAKRAQESLRSLEEFSKIDRPESARKFESLRYRAYTLERMLAVRRPATHILHSARLYVLLSGAECESSLDWTIAEAAAGGATAFQLREKSLNDRDLLARARDVRRWTRAAKSLLILNDRPDIARLAEADGVHLGQDDLPVKAARAILGADAIIGVSTHTIDQVRQALRDGADYIGIGPTFPSSTKSFDEFPGLDFVRAVAAETALPAFAIGGISAENVGRVHDAGGRRVAVGAAIGRAAQPKSAARDILNRITLRE